MNVLRASLVGAVVLTLGRAASAGRELFIARTSGPTEELAAYVIGATVVLTVGGLLAGVASSMLLRAEVHAAEAAYFILATSICGVSVAAVWLGLVGDLTAQTTLALSLTLPAFGIYGIANGELMLQGRAVQGMALAAWQPLLATVLAFTLPLSPVNATIVGHIIGAWSMALIGITVTRGRSWRSKASRVGPLTRRVGAVLVLVAAVNVANPIVDRLLAATLGAGALAVLNLGSLAFMAITGTLGIAIGNLAASEASRGKAHPRLVAATTFGSGALGILMLSVSAAGASQLLAGTDFTTADLSAMRSCAILYCVAIPAALVGQVMVRVWFVSARKSHMLRLAVVLAAANGLLDLALIEQFGVLGIPLATILVSFTQAAVILAIRNRSAAVVQLTLTTGLLGGVAWMAIGP